MSTPAISISTDPGLTKYVARALRTPSKGAARRAPRRATPRTIEALSAIAAVPSLARVYRARGALGASLVSQHVYAIRKAVFALAAAECIGEGMTTSRRAARRMGPFSEKLQERFTELWARVGSAETDALFVDDAGAISLGDRQHLLSLVGLTAAKARARGWTHVTLQMAAAFALSQQCAKDLHAAILYAVEEIGRSDALDGPAATDGLARHDVWRSLDEAMDAAKTRLRCARAVLKAFSLATHWPVVRATLVHCQTTCIPLDFLANLNAGGYALPEGHVAGVDDWFVDATTPLRHANFGRTPAGLAEKVQRAAALAESAYTIGTHGGEESAKSRAESVRHAISVSNRSVPGDSATAGTSLDEHKLADRAASSVIRAALTPIVREMLCQGTKPRLPTVIKVLTDVAWPSVRVGQTVLDVRSIKSFIVIGEVLGPANQKRYQVGLANTTVIMTHAKLNLTVHAVRNLVKKGNSQPG